jgi:hypothetical protein
MLLKRARTLLGGLWQYNKSSFTFIVKTEYHFFLEKKEVKGAKDKTCSLKNCLEMSPFQSLKSLKPGPKAF